jgi:hypothetical protein
MEMRQENLSIISHNRDEIELKIEYKDYLTPEQLSNFYVALNQILTFHNIKDVEVNAKEGSLITILKKFAIASLPLLLGSFSNPEPQNLKFTAKIANSFNNNNFINFIINKTTIYNEDNIAQKSKELDEKLKEVDLIEEVEMLQMRIAGGVQLDKKTNKKGCVTEKTKCEFIADFDDSRYNQTKPLKIIIGYEDIEEYFEEIPIKDADKYYFIADGKLTKDRGKYIKFEITKILKKPTLIESPQLELF